jgi:hypothetical protein
MGKGRRIAAVSSLACLAVLVAAATALALSVPSVGTTGLTTTVPSQSVTVPVPNVTTPKVSTPKVSTPGITAPKVTVPKTTVPKVSTPTVTTPKTTPKVTSPGAAVPGTTDVSSGIKRVASGPRGGSQTVSRVVSSPSLPSRTAGGIAQGSPLAKSGGGAGGGQSPSGSNGALMPGSGGGPSAGGGAPGAGGGFTGTGTGAGDLQAFALLPGGEAALQLRAALEPLLGCFYSLSPFQQEVLSLRAGLDGGAPISRGQLASAFGVTPVDVRRTEAAALRRLRVASVEDGCMATGAGLAAAGAAFIGGPFGPVGFISPAIGQTLRSGFAVASTGLPGGAVEARSITDRLSALGEDGQGPTPWLMMLITLMLCASFGALLREARRSV